MEILSYLNVNYRSVRLKRENMRNKMQKRHRKDFKNDIHHNNFKNNGKRSYNSIPHVNSIPKIPKPRLTNYYHENNLTKKETDDTHLLEEPKHSNAVGIVAAILIPAISIIIAIVAYVIRSRRLKREPRNRKKRKKEKQKQKQKMLRIGKTDSRSGILQKERWFSSHCRAGREPGSIFIEKRPNIQSENISRNMDPKERIELSEAEFSCYYGEESERDTECTVKRPKLRMEKRPPMNCIHEAFPASKGSLHLLDSEMRRNYHWVSNLYSDRQTALSASTESSVLVLPHDEVEETSQLHGIPKNISKPAVTHSKSKAQSAIAANHYFENCAEKINLKCIPNRKETLVTSSKATQTLIKSSSKATQTITRLFSKASQTAVPSLSKLPEFAVESSSRPRSNLERNLIISITDTTKEQQFSRCQNSFPDDKQVWTTEDREYPSEQRDSLKTRNCSDISTDLKISSPKNTYKQCRRQELIKDSMPSDCKIDSSVSHPVRESASFTNDKIQRKRIFNMDKMSTKQQLPQTENKPKNKPMWRLVGDTWYRN